MPGNSTRTTNVTTRATTTGTGATIALTASGGGFSDQGMYMPVTVTGPCATAVMVVSPCPTVSNSSLTNRHGLTRQFTITNVTTEPLSMSFSCAVTGSASSCIALRESQLPTGSKMRVRKI